MGEVTYKLYSCMLMWNIQSDANVSGHLMFNMLHLVSSDVCAILYFV